MPEPAKTDSKAAKSDAAKPKESSAKNDTEDFDWLIYQDPYESRGENKFAMAVTDNPLVPLGAAATVIALGCGLFNLLKQNSKKQQFYMRARVGAQGFTIVSLVGGMFYQASKKQ